MQVNKGKYDYSVLLKNGIMCKWFMSGQESIKGYKFSSMYIDENVDEDFFHERLCACGYFCTKDSVWVI